MVLSIPEHRIADAMLALGMKGFADVMAYESRGAQPGEGEASGRDGQ